MDRSGPTEPPQRGEPSARFATTRWSLVLAAGGTETDLARPALGKLIETYWYPLYAFLRRKGHSAEDAADLTQEFLAHLLERNHLELADPERGRFRSFLLTAFERFVVDDLRRAGRKKRGGGRSPLRLSLLEAEDRYRLEPADHRTPESLYERRWAMTLLETAFRRLEEEHVASGRAALFAVVKPVLGGDRGARPYAEIALELKMKEGALKTLIHRMRRRFRTLLRAEIAETVSDPRDIDEEVRHLFQSFE